MTDISSNDLAAALRRIATTTDGKLLYLHLQSTLMDVATPIESGALQANHGARKFARELMALMSAGIAERTDDYASGGRFELIVLTYPKPVAVADAGRKSDPRAWINANPSA